MECCSTFKTWHFWTELCVHTATSSESLAPCRSLWLLLQSVFLPQQRCVVIEQSCQLFTLTLLQRNPLNAAQFAHNHSNCLVDAPHSYLVCRFTVETVTHKHPSQIKDTNTGKRCDRMRKDHSAAKKKKKKGEPYRFAITLNVNAAKLKI